MIESRRIKQRAKLARPLLTPLILNIGLLAAAVWWTPRIETAWRYVVALLPMVPVLFLVFRLARVATMLDDLERRILLEAAAFSFIFTLFLLLGFGLLGLVGVAQPSAIVVVAMMCFFLVIGKFWGNWKYR